MSLESKIDDLTKAVVALTQAMGAVGAASVVQQAPPAAPVAPAAPATPPADIVMPAPPSFAPSAAPAAPAAPAVPFTDTDGLVAYATQAFHALTAKGPGWNEGIQRTITSMVPSGDINGLTPAQYPAFYAAIEALKA